MTYWQVIDHKEIWFSDKIKLYFFQTVVVSILLYGCTTCILMKHTAKKARWELHKNAMCCFKQILEAAPHKIAAVWSLTWMVYKIGGKKNKTCWDKWSKDKLISYVLLWIPTHGYTGVGQQARVMDDRDG